MRYLFKSKSLTFFAIAAFLVGGFFVANTANAVAVPFDNSNYYYTNITNAPDGTKYRQAGLSPDGTKIVAVKNVGTTPTTGWWEIVLMNVDGSGQTVISAGDSGTGDIYEYTNPFWSDDGTAIGFLEVHDANPNKVRVYNISSGTRSYIYEPVATDVASPDFLGGSKTSIVFWAYGPVGGADLFTWDGATRTNITNTPLYKEYEPMSNADGTKIVYWSGETADELVNTTHTLTYSGGVWTKDVGFTPIVDSYWGYFSNRSDNYIAVTTGLIFSGGNQVGVTDVKLYDSSGTLVQDLTGPGYTGSSGQYNFFGNMPEGPHGEFVLTSNAWRINPTVGRDIIITVPRSTLYVDDTGSDSNPGTAAAPFATIQKAINEVANGGTVNVAAGTYTEVGQIVINKNLSIVGVDKATTIIKPAQNTGDDSTADPRGWFLVDSGKTFNLSNVTLNGEGKLIREAIRSNGNGTIENCLIINIKYSKYLGTAIVLYGNGSDTVNINNCEFSNIERVGILTKGPIHGIFNKNTYTGKGNTGDWLDYGIEIQYGAHVTISNNTISNNIGVATIDGSTSSGISIFGDEGDNVILTGNTLTNNTVGVAIATDEYSAPTYPIVNINSGNIFSGGNFGIEIQRAGTDGSPTLSVDDATFSGNTTAVNIQAGMTASSTTIHNSLFSGSGVGITNNGIGTLDATYNHWGTSTPDFSTLVSTSSVTYSPYWLNQEMSLPSSLIAVFNGVHSTLEEAGIANNIDTCSTHPNSCSDLYFEKSIDGVKMGKITFNSTLDLTNTETQTFLQNLGSKMDMAGAGVIGLDFTGVTTSNTLKGVTATIKFYGLDKLGFDASSTAAEINSRLVAVDENGNALDRSSLISDSNTGTYTVPVGACEVGGACYTFEIPVNHFTKYKVLEKTQVAPETNEDGDGMATINSETPEVVIASSTQPLIITITAGTNNATINYDSLITNGTGVIPETTINTESADIAIPASTTVTSASTTWNGIMAAPTITTITLPPTTGQTKTLSSAIELGFSGAKLSFDKGVRILMTGQTGKRAGYIRSGEGFTEITAACAEDNQTWADSHLGTDEECKIDSGSDLVIWTKHFTTFATYTQTTNTTSSGGGGYVPTTACTEVTYSEWGNSFNGIQYRNVLSQTPNNCSLTASQRAAQSRTLAQVVEPVKTEITPATSQVSEPTQQVLGVKKYADGTLLRGTDNRIYVLIGDKLQYIPTLKELAKYKRAVLRVTDETIASFAKTAVLGVKKYANGTLIKAKGDVKIYVIKDGKKMHIKSLAELKQYKGKTLTVEASELNNY